MPTDTVRCTCPFEDGMATSHLPFCPMATDEDEATAMFAFGFAEGRADRQSRLEPSALSDEDGEDYVAGYWAGWNGDPA